MIPFPFLCDCRLPAEWQQASEAITLANNSSMFLRLTYFSIIYIVLFFPPDRTITFRVTIFKKFQEYDEMYLFFCLCNNKKRQTQACRQKNISVKGKS